LLAIGVGVSSMATASTTINFNPNGTGAPGVQIGSFDWLPGNAVNIGGNPPNGLTVGSTMVILSQSQLNSAVAPDGTTPVPVPAGTEFTYTMSIPVKVASVFGPNSGAFTLDLQSSAQNFVEIWTSAPDSNTLAGTGFNNGKRIFYGLITDAFGSLSVVPCPDNVASVQFDQFPSAADNDFPGTNTVCASGSTKISVNVIDIDPDYFPGFTLDQLNTLKSFFNTSTIVPFNQQNPSRLFVSTDAGTAGSPSPAPDVMPKLGAVNGAIQQTETLDFQTQADANQAFQPGTEVPGTCRVTYGGNDKNGNVDPAKFGSACSSDKGKAQNCYTFGGQAGAPTADPAQGGPFGEHTHHNVSGPAGDFVFHAGSHSAPKSTRLTAVACKDPDACQPAAANARFKQIDFEGTGTFRTLDATATAYLSGKVGHPVLPDNQDTTSVYYFRVDMDDLGEPGNKPSSKHPDTADAVKFFNDDQNNPLATADPTFFSYFADKKTACTSSADVYQILICRDATPCGPGTNNPNPPIYAVRGFLTGGNIQIHPIIK
jgi:hypothetical protein